MSFNIYIQEPARSDKVATIAVDPKEDGVRSGPRITREVGAEKARGLAIQLLLRAEGVPNDLVQKVSDWLDAKDRMAAV
jgi:hypothetical protein